MSLPQDAPAITPDQLGQQPAPLAGPLNPDTWEERQLYGGAISACIPKRFSDCSAFRHIPDHQEVWADADSDQSLILELNALDAEVTDEQAAEHYMHDLAAANEALSNEVLQTGPMDHTAMPGFDASIPKYFIVSNQRVSKFKESADKANTVQIYMAVVRLKAVGTDLLLSYNVPLQFGEGSSSEGRPILSQDENMAVIQGVMSTIRINDWALFGSS